MRYINADELLELYDIDLDGLETDKPWTIPLEVVKQNIKDMPTADVVEVVRCKDCKWYKECFMLENDDDYCSNGERKDGEEE